MTAPHATVDDARQLHRLRALQVRRARDAVARARDAVAVATADVAAREAQIAAGRAAMAALAQDLAGRFAPELPRIIELATAERRRLIDRIERDEDALLGERDALETALAQRVAASTALSRALGREDLSQALLRDSRRRDAQRREQRAESEIDDGRGGLTGTTREARR